MLLKFSMGFEFHLSNEKHYELKSFQTDLISLLKKVGKSEIVLYNPKKKARENYDIFILQSLLVSQYPFSLESNF